MMLKTEPLEFDELAFISLVKAKIEARAEKEFWLRLRRALLSIVREIERVYGVN